MKMLWSVALGAAFGGCVRYGADLLWLQLGAGSFPLATFLVNLSGSLAIGYFAGCWSKAGQLVVPTQHWHFWVTGFCGGYTTFSTFAWELLEMIRVGEGQAAGVYAAASVGLGVIAVWLGLSLAIKRTTSEAVELDNE